MKAGKTIFIDRGVLLCPDCLKKWLEREKVKNESLIPEIYRLLKLHFPDLVEAAQVDECSYMRTLRKNAYENPFAISHSQDPRMPLTGSFLLGFDISLESLYPLIREMAEKEKSPAPGA